MADSSVRKEIDDLIAANDMAAANRALADMWRAAPGLAAAGFVLPRFQKTRAARLGITHRAFIARSFTVEPIMPLLLADALAAGIDLDLEVGDFNGFGRELVDPGSALHQFAPDSVFLAWQTRDLLGELWDGDPPPPRISQLSDQFLAETRDLIEGFRRCSRANLVIHNLDRAPGGGEGAAAIDAINRALGDMAEAEDGVYVLDYRSLAATHGAGGWYDEARWAETRLPIAAPRLIHMARAWSRYVIGLSGRTAKCLVIDLDGTFWGGTVGEDGVAGLALDGPYRRLHAVLGGLFDAGILLAICSKNNEADALEAFAAYPDMAVRLDHFAARRINWSDKAANLAAIAEELNIGVDALAFLDDNPAERALIRQALPDVRVLSFPEDPDGLAAAVAGDPFLQPLRLTEDDRQRGRIYADERRRRQLQATSVSLEDYFHSLDMELEFGTADHGSIARIAQLTQKTNQLNLTGKRYTESHIRAFQENPDALVATVRVRDRFGDQGMVGVAIVVGGGARPELDTLLMSCRVIGRQVETALLSHVAGLARQRGAVGLVGRYQPTPKNAPARSILADAGFEKTGEDEAGTLWYENLEAGGVGRPPWFRVKGE